MTQSMHTAQRGFGLPASVWKPVSNLLAIALTLLAIAWALDVPRMFGWGVYPQQFMAAILALALPIAFLVFPRRRGSERVLVPWYDVLAAAGSLVAILYVAFEYPNVVNFIFARPASAYVPGLLITALLLEGLRRTAGWSLVAIVVVFLAYGLLANLVPGDLAGRAQDWRMLSGYMAYDSNGILGIPLRVAATVIVAFVLFGNLLAASGGSKFFTDAALLGMGRFRGGSMKIAVLASGLFGSVSGSAVANVVATGVVTVPMIKRDGYPAHKAGAIEAVASTGGQLMPPVMGAAAFLMAQFLQISYSAVALAALVPALLYYLALFIQADLEAARIGISRVPEEDIPGKRMVLGGTHFALAFALLIYALFALRWQPERAALAATLCVAVTALAFGYGKRRPSLRALFNTLAETGHSVVGIIVICAGAGLVIGVLNVTGLSFNLTSALVALGGGNKLLLLLMSAAVCIVLGMGLPTLGVYVLLATLVAPALAALDIEPIAAHLYVLYFGMMSMITPPIAIAAFAAAGIAKAPAMQTSLAAVKFGWVAYLIPLLFVYSPSLILIGSPVEVTVAVVTAGFGVWLVSAALAGYFAARLAPVTRLLFAAAGLLALLPSGLFGAGSLTDIVGVLGGAALMAIEFFAARRSKWETHLEQGQ
jgi:TRAP transporter 4TM/12TM fusion protein